MFITFYSCDMSEYLGWTERKPPFGTDISNYRDKILVGGPITHSYENYIKNIFHPMNRLKTDSSQQLADGGLSASTMLKVERSFGRHAIDDTIDITSKDNNSSSSIDDLLRTPLETLYSDLGLKSPEYALYRQFPVYIPKQSSEYFAISHGADRRLDRYPNSGCYSSYREKDDEEYAKNNHKTLIDYKEFDSSPLSPFLYRDHPYVRSQDTRIIGSNFVQVSSPLSPFLYRDHPYVRSQDTRIIGSNFVQLTSRPKDRFLEKIDQTLAEVRAMPRYV
ncbi:hypothetical protein DICVIV_08063 [Dictyocaulus viviparus]|uniref:Uncharacterized protein n=1 Tax=Dictyocaulus viviparus TaxID=29172 RepID=A0A0D8XQ02_DICVI|nr:hypothetical protein DICVIV_08063 [Dictyocaulus viviparus]